MKTRELVCLLLSMPNQDAEVYLGNETNRFEEDVGTVVVGVSRTEHTNVDDKEAVVVWGEESR